MEIDKKRDYDHVVGNQYGMIKGGPELLFIKTGRSGTIYGYENKYLEIAREVNKKYGCSVAVSANPVDSNSSILYVTKYFQYTCTPDIRCIPRTLRIFHYGV